MEALSERRLWRLRHNTAFSDDALAVYRANVSAPGAATAMLNWYRAAGRDLFKSRDIDAPIDTPTLMIWGERDIALGLSCLEGTDRYVRDPRIERLPGVAHWTLEDEIWPRKSEQGDKWIFCLTAANMMAANQERR